ncbi:hypothetical protein QFC21_002630 [Naganishia friedmannii]|uniref:Uncharacterized protein n=1 Tax=Naganishia friedmannii TaxID=89922 RepID=A0ACC2VV45_9TREE|nr:hypothetical protein QFC21_002630 [Naganishia friedmannii]
MSGRNDDSNTMAVSLSGASGPVRPFKAKQTRQRRAPGNNKPYARPASKSQAQSQSGDGSFSEGLKRSDSQSSLFGGIKSVFGRLFGGGSGADAETETSSRSKGQSSQRDSNAGDESFDPDRTKSAQGDFSTDDSEDEGDDSRYQPAEGDMDESFDNGPRTSGSGGGDMTTGDSNKRFLPSPEQASSQPSSKRIRRASPSPERRPMGFKKSEMGRNGMSGSVSLGYASPSLSSIAREPATGNLSSAGPFQLSGMRRSGTLLNLDLHRSVRPGSEIARQTEQSHQSSQQQTLPVSSGLRNSKVWSPWNEQDEAGERRQRSSVASSTRGFSRSGSVGYGLNAAAASPARHSYAGMAHARAGGRMDLASYGGPPSASPFAAPAHPSSPARPRTVLHPLQSASITRSPSLPGGRMRPLMPSLSAMRDPYQRDRGRDSTALPSSPLVTQTHTAQHQRQQEIERSPSAHMMRDSSVLSGMSDLGVREPLAQSNKRSKMQVLTPEVFELQHKTEADRILASLTNMRNVNPASNSGLSASYSSRTLRKQISVPAPSPLQDFDPLSLASSGLGKLRKTREMDTSVMVSPYANKRARGRKLQVEDSEESGDEGGQSRKPDNEDKPESRNVSEAATERRHRSQTPMREISSKQPGSPAPAEPKRADPALFPEPTIKVSKPLPVAFSPSAKNLPSSARTTSSLRAKTTMTTRKHTSAAGSAASSPRPGRFSAVDYDDDEDDYSPDLAELEAAAAAKASSGSAFSSAPKITGPMDLFAPKIAAPASSTSGSQSEGAHSPASTSKDEQQPGSLRQAPNFLNVKADHRPRASSPLKAMVVPSPESNKSSPSASQSASGSSIPSFSFAKPSMAADVSKPSFSFALPGSSGNAEQPAAPASKSTFNFGLGKPSSSPVPAASSSFTFGTPDKSTTSQDVSTTPKAPAPSTTSFSFTTQNRTNSEAPKMPSFSFGASSSSDKSASGPPAIVEKPALAAAPAEPQGVAPPKAGLFSFSSAPASTAVADIVPAAKASLPTGNPFASVAPASNSTLDPPSNNATSTSGSSQNQFSFGAPAVTPAASPAILSQDKTANVPASSSLFGSTTPASPAPPVASTFNFGAPASNAAGGATSAPSFSFGKSAETAKPTASPSFAFGTRNAAPSGSTAAQVAQKPQPVPSFSFGAPSNTSFNAATAANVGGFGSGGTPTPSTSTGFNFGSTAPSFGTSSPAATGFGAAPATAMFGSANTTAAAASVTPAFGGFGGSTATPTPPATNTGFNFAAPTPPSFNAPFAFGAPLASSAAPAVASFGGFGSASPAFGAREATATPPPTFNMGNDNAPSSPGGRKIRSMPKRKK